MSEPASESPVSPSEARVLGCLIEKELATPEYYPLTLNSLVNACNQKSNRLPLMALSDREVEQALEGLRQQRLAALFSGADSRVAKYKQSIDRVFPMETPERVVLCELLLRGPQTPGELRTHCNRMHKFENVAAIEKSLTLLAQRAGGPLVASLSRQSGQKEMRFAQLLTGAIPESPAKEVPGRPVAVEPKTEPDSGMRLAALEAEVKSLREQFEQLRAELGS